MRRRLGSNSDYELNVHPLFRKNPDSDVSEGIRDPEVRKVLEEVLMAIEAQNMMHFLQVLDLLNGNASADEDDVGGATA